MTRANWVLILIVAIFVLGICPSAAVASETESTVTVEITPTTSADTLDADAGSDSEDETSSTAGSQLLNRENITFLIAVLGFGMSIYNFVDGIVQKWTRLKIDFPNVFRIETHKRCLDVIQVKIINLSARPVVLSRMTVTNYLNSASFGTYRRELIRIEKRMNQELTDKTRWLSDALPIEIPGHGYVNLLLMSDSEKQILLKDARHSIKLHTGHRTIRKSLVISDFSDLLLMSECREPN